MGNSVRQSIKLHRMQNLRFRMQNVWGRLQKDLLRQQNDLLPWRNLWSEMHVRRRAPAVPHQSSIPVQELARGRVLLGIQHQRDHVQIDHHGLSDVLNMHHPSASKAPRGVEWPQQSAHCSALIVGAKNDAMSLLSTLICIHIPALINYHLSKLVVTQ